MVALLLAVSLLALVTVTLTAVVREVRDDGYGHRPSPRHADAWAPAGLPSAPYRASAGR